MAKRTRRSGVKKDIRTQALVPFNVSADNKFNIAKMTNAEVKVYKKKDDTHRPILELTFTDAAEERTFIHKEWPVEEEFTSKRSGKVNTVEDQWDWQDRFLAHIFNTFMGEGAHADVNLGKAKSGEFDLPEELDAETYGADYDFFAKVAKQFKEANDGKPVFENADGKAIPVWIKLVYTKGGDLVMPKFGNVLDRWVKGKPTLLTMDKDDKFEKSTYTPTAPTSGVASSAGVSEIDDDDMPDGF